MIKGIKMFKVGDHGEVPGPEVYWMKEFSNWFRLCFYSFLVDTNDGLLLVNTGPPRELAPRNKFLKEWSGNEECKFSVSEEEKIENTLGRLGVSPEDIAHIIVTPFQDYTIGKLDLFVNARIYFSRKGWFEDVVSPRDSLFINHDIYFPKEIRKFLFEDAWNKIVLVENEEILDGVSVRWTGGHHRSSMAVILETSNGIVSITDSAFTARNLEENIPIGIAENIYECLDAYNLLRRLSKKIIPAYDPSNSHIFKEFFVA